MWRWVEVLLLPTPRPASACLLLECYCVLGGHTSGRVFGSVPVVCAWLGGYMLCYLLQCICLDMYGWFGSECLVEYVLCGPVSDV